MAEPLNRVVLAYSGGLDTSVILRWLFKSYACDTRLIEHAEARRIPIGRDKRGEASFSTDANLLHTSCEGLVLEDPWEEIPDHVYSRTDLPEDAPDAPEYVTVDFERSDAVALEGEGLSPANLLDQRDAEGFIELAAHRLRLLGRRAS